ncbi:MAG: potassium channel family protein [Reichenbachiella sp.]|uniref:potassium channel family protein n=1 Tax=Reichenbachiella sp. TaxID=2184521 RepID=UPI002966395D|nr:potassium channel family protein [Reichenbachiella sp.]MDW3210885.1 potassium channel family protein [Reichenbachiella sp.]
MLFVKEDIRESLITSYKYQILFFIMLVNILLPGFFPQEMRYAFVSPALNILMLGSCFLVIQKHRKTALYILMLGILGVVFNWFEGYAGLIGLVIFSFFIGIVAFELFSDLVAKKNIGVSEIFGAFDGYMLIGYIGALLSLAIHFIEPAAYSNIAEGREGSQDLLYFSYITMLTIGYGDIAPLLSASKGLSIVLGLVGQFYLVVVVATFVGKFLRDSNTK